ncbi:hypothetical protein MMPV_009356 [Pyropia vietnamensis]
MAVSPAFGRSKPPPPSSRAAAAAGAGGRRAATASAAAPLAGRPRPGFLPRGGEASASSLRQPGRPPLRRATSLLSLYPPGGAIGSGRRGSDATATAAGAAGAGRRDSDVTVAVDGGRRVSDVTTAEVAGRGLDAGVDAAGRTDRRSPVWWRRPFLPRAATLDGPGGITAAAAAAAAAAAMTAADPRRCSTAPPWIRGLGDCTLPPALRPPAPDPAAVVAPRPGVELSPATASAETSGEAVGAGAAGEGGTAAGGGAAMPRPRQPPRRRKSVQFADAGAGGLDHILGVDDHLRLASAGRGGGGRGTATNSDATTTPWRVGWGVPAPATAATAPTSSPTAALAAPVASAPPPASTKSTVAAAEGAIGNRTDASPAVAVAAAPAVGVNTDGVKGTLSERFSPCLPPPHAAADVEAAIAAAADLRLSLEEPKRRSRGDLLAGSPVDSDDTPLGDSGGSSNSNSSGGGKGRGGGGGGGAPSSIGTGASSSPLTQASLPAVDVARYWAAVSRGRALGRSPPPPPAGRAERDTADGDAGGEGGRGSDSDSDGGSVGSSGSSSGDRRRLLPRRSSSVRAAAMALLPPVRARGDGAGVLPAISDAATAAAAAGAPAAGMADNPAALNATLLMDAWLPPSATVGSAAVGRLATLTGGSGATAWAGRVGGAAATGFRPGKGARRRQRRPENQDAWVCLSPYAPAAAAVTSATAAAAAAAAAVGVASKRAARGGVGCGGGGLRVRGLDGPPAPPHTPLLAGVFDGHGHSGAAAARLVRDVLPAFLSRALQEERTPFPSLEKGEEGGGRPSTAGRPSQPPPAAAAAAAAAATSAAHARFAAAAASAFPAAEAALTAPAVGIDHHFSGTTAVVAYIPSPADVYVAWAGDSRAVLGTPPAPGSPALVPMALSADHTPAVRAEARRITAAGGRLACPGGRGPTRVYLPRHPIPGAAMSRSVGDTAIAAVGVTASPEVVHVAVPPSGGVLLLATDGLWAVLSPAAAMAVVATARGGGDRQQKPRRHWWLMPRSGGRRGGVADDICAVVVYLPGS